MQQYIKPPQARSAGPPKTQRETIERFLAELGPGNGLASIVEGPQVQDRLRAFETADMRALKEQRRYKRWRQYAMRATTFGILVGAFLLLPLGQGITGLSRTIISGLQTLAPVVTIGAMLLVTWFKPLGEWKSSRAAAEKCRGAIFAEILNGAPPPGTDAATLPKQKQQLLMKAHVEDQLAFFKKRIRAHEKAGSQYSPIRLSGYLLIGCAVAVGGAAKVHELGVVLPDVIVRVARWMALTDANRWQLGLTTIASGVLAHASARTLMNEDERTAALYKITQRNLRKLIERDRSNVEAATGRGDEAALLKFFTDARAILEQEHLAWSLVSPVVDGAPSE